MGWHLLGRSHPAVYRISALAGLFYPRSRNAYITPLQLALAVGRSFQSLKDKQLNLWKLMLRDGLNLYGVSPTAILSSQRNLR